MHISVSMIVKNEESCLATALDSICTADEIIVVDTGSTDSTVDIARRYTDKVFTGPEFAWRDDFAFSRNQSLERCTGDWVLIIDADEELELGGIEKLRSIISQAGDHKAIMFHTVGRGNTSMHLSQRAFRRCPEIFWQGAIHNHLNISGGYASDIQITYGYSKAHRQDPDRALRILTKELERNPKAVRETYYLAREYWYRRNYIVAAKWYSDYLTRATWAPEMADAWLMLSKCLWKMQKQDLARDACLQAIKINANFKEAQFFMAEMSGPKNAARWRQIAETADNSDVLFVRTHTKEMIK